MEMVVTMAIVSIVAGVSIVGIESAKSNAALGDSSRQLNADVQRARRVGATRRQTTTTVTTSRVSAASLAPGSSVPRSLPSPQSVPTSITTTETTRFGIIAVLDDHSYAVLGDVDATPNNGNESTIQVVDLHEISRHLQIGPVGTQVRFGPSGFAQLAGGTPRITITDTRSGRSTNLDIMGATQRLN